MIGDGEQPMGANESRPHSWVERQGTLHLPRYIVEHIGQVLRNRTREDLLVPVPPGMLALLGTAGQSTSPTSLDRKL